MKFRTLMPLYRRLTDSDTDTAAKAGSVKSKTLTYITVLTILCALVAALGVAPATAGETVLHSFNPYPRGAYPQASLCRGADGKFYGTTSNGGSAGAGVVFNLDKKGHETVLYNFTGGADGGNPYAAVICDSAGNIYGTTSGGGSAGAGVVFRVNGVGHESVLYSFTGGADGGYPSAGVIRDSAGNLYGMTCCGGTAGAGVVFKLDTKGHETVLYSFTGGADGGYPFGYEQGVIMDSAGNLYGTTTYGGVAGAGVVFKLDRKGDETVLYSFTGGNDGGYPTRRCDPGLGRQPLRHDQRRRRGRCGGGVQIGYGRAMRPCCTASPDGTDGGYLLAGVIQDWAGDLYGTTAYGGAAGAGVVFKLDSEGQ